MDDLLQNLTWLDKQQPEMVSLVKKLAEINSGTMNLDGIERVRKVLCDKYQVVGGRQNMIDLVPLENVNQNGEIERQPMGRAIHIVKRPEIRPRVVLCIHMDTVYDLAHPFQSCRMLDDTKLNGPGVADAKGGLVVMLYALQCFEQSPLAKKIGWEVIINPDEELGSPGSANFLKERASDADTGLLFEPTLPDGTMVSWRKGTGNFSFVVRGKSAHSGREFDKGRNAIVALARLLDQIDRLNTDSDVTYNVGRVEGGSALNIVPDLAIGRVNVRVKTVEQGDQVLKHFKHLVEQTNQLEGFQCSMHGKFTSPPKVIDDGTKKIQRLIEECGDQLGIPVKWRGTGGACDGNKFAAAGLPNIDTLGPCGANIHSSDEYVLIDSLVPRAKLTCLILMKLASGD